MDTLNLQSILKTKTRFILISVLFLFFISWLIGKSFIYNTNEFFEFVKLVKAKSYSLTVLNDPLFWNHSIGICTKISIDIFICSLFFYIILLAFNLTSSLKPIIKIVALSQLVFVLQFWIELIYILWMGEKNNHDYLKEFSLLSVHHVTTIFNLKYPYYLKYPFQILGVFEIFYWITLCLLLSIRFKIKYAKAFLIVTLAYILPLIIWFLFIVLQSIK